MPIIITGYKTGGSSVPPPPSVQVFTLTEAPVSVDMRGVPLSGTIRIQAWGAAGGSNFYGRGGFGGYAEGTFSVSDFPTGILTINVGGGGKSTGFRTLSGGYNGGGNAGGTSSVLSSGGGGGSSIYDQTTPIVVAGGGAGGARSNSLSRIRNGGSGGGSGGDPNGIDGDFRVGGSLPGRGATQLAGGQGGDAIDGPAFDGQTGLLGQGGAGGEGGSSYGSGGGGGLYGGGGGANATSSSNVSAGGGGSSYVAPSGSSIVYDGIITFSDPPPQSTDPNYISGVGFSQPTTSGSTTGGPGLIVITWA